MNTGSVFFKVVVIVLPSLSTVKSFSCCLEAPIFLAITFPSAVLPAPNKEPIATLPTLTSPYKAFSLRATSPPAIPAPAAA